LGTTSVNMSHASRDYRTFASCAQRLCIVCRDETADVQDAERIGSRSHSILEVREDFAVSVACSS
jgi:hypothetical protein